MDGLMTEMFPSTRTDIECEVCHTEIQYKGRNRLSNCGHMRRSNGTWVPRDKGNNYLDSTKGRAETGGGR